MNNEILVFTVNYILKKSDLYSDEIYRLANFNLLLDQANTKLELNLNITYFIIHKLVESLLDLINVETIVLIRREVVNAVISYWKLKNFIPTTGESIDNFFLRCINNTEIKYSVRQLEPSLVPFELRDYISKNTSEVLKKIILELIIITNTPILNNLIIKLQNDILENLCVLYYF